MKREREKEQREPNPKTAQSEECQDPDAKPSRPAHTSEHATELYLSPTYQLKYK